MAAPADRVQLTKQESAAGGGDAADVDEFLNTAPVNANEDAPEVQGVFFQAPSPATTSDEVVYVSRDGSGNLCFKDGNTLEKTLTQLAAAGQTTNEIVAEILVDDNTGDVVTEDGEVVIDL